MTLVVRDASESGNGGDPSVARGFTFIEVVVSMAVTLVVMASIFGLLVRSSRSFETELERSDLQAQARSALDHISRDLLQAGTGLPPEFPAITPPHVNPELDASGGGPEAIEIIGAFGTNAGGVDPVPIVSFDGETVKAQALPSGIAAGDLMLVYDDEPVDGTWVFGIVSEVHRGSPAELTLKVRPGDSENDTTLPYFIDNYNRRTPSTGFITPVTVVTYRTERDSSADAGDENVLWRQINWGEPMQLAFVEDLQFRYFVGDTVNDVGVPPIFAPSDPPFRGFRDEEKPKSFSDARFASPNPNPPQKLDAEPKSVSDARSFPPLPQPNPSIPISTNRVVRSVGVSVTSRSHRGNLEGATVLSGQSPDETGYLRATFTSRVATRNLIFRFETRQHTKSPD